MTDGAGDKGSFMDREKQEMKSIILEHKVFWTTIPIDLPVGQERPVRVGIAVALVGTEADKSISEDEGEKSTAFEKLFKIAKWLTSEDKPGIRFDIRRHDNVVFYFPEDIKTKRKNYAITIRILHSEQFDLPMDETQAEIFRDIEKKLKEIDSPKEHWQERKTGL